MMGIKRRPDEKDTKEKQDEDCGLILDCQVDVEIIDLDPISKDHEEEQMPKKRCLEHKSSPKPKTNTTMRRSACLETLCASKNGGLPVMPLAPYLPPSSENLDLQDITLADFFYVYSFLRTFSMVLFISPFTIEAFAESLSCQFSNSLIDFAHFSLLKIIKKHLEYLAGEDDVFASNLLRYFALFF